MLMHAASLLGTGTIDASGGDDVRTSSRYGGLGGGGRVALWVDDMSGFPVENVRVEGGTRTASNGVINADTAAGTLFIRELGATHGDLVIDAHTVVNGGARTVTATFLPSLPLDSVTATEVDAASGTDLWITASAALPMKWLGAGVRLLDGAGAELGVFRAAEIDDAGRLRLEGASSQDAAAASFEGVYRFDSVVVRGGAGLDADSTVEADQVDVIGPAVALPPSMAVSDLTVTAGSRLVSAQGQSLDIVASGTVTVAAGASIDVSHEGYAGGTDSHYSGYTAPNVTGATRSGGGGHGGEGYQGNYTGSQGPVFDSVYAPGFPGGGGARGNGGETGGRGGGVIRITAQHLVLDGELLARGQNRTGVYAGAGAGGTVALDLAQLSGAGSIDASGGDNPRNSSRYGGVGGGGRVAIEVGTLTGFDPATQVLVEGGLRTSSSGTPNVQAGAGTLFVKGPADTHGHLTVDQGPVYASIPMTKTPLPTVGSGTVGAVEADLDVPADLWLEDVDPAALFNHGVTGAHVRIGGVDYRILDFTEDLRRVLLEGAAGVVTGGETYEGVYKFDSVTVRGRGHLVFDDIDDV
ncbi:MAG: hypothetical protein AAFY88_18765, partial [Acidobacteriota bacterium]